ncbi:hypothetical protein D6D22_08938 [Aureobasidium pullulans]|uniref:DUF7702 domain-containing protein n=1 Tax=Aureobasidium pullulans TaxID=5580 RepID=A0A4S8X8H7_AURPU|nr:hypothetical protein D6D22_08938 [Aureobasidium pullulans]
MTYGDHHLTFRTSISIAQIPVFSLSLLIAYYFRRTHRMGWFCIGIFSIIRLVSASCLLALINEDKHSLRATVFVCENLGIMLFVFIFVEVLEWPPLHPLDPSRQIPRSKTSEKCNDGSGGLYTIHGDQIGV